MWQPSTASQLYQSKQKQYEKRCISARRIALGMGLSTQGPRPPSVALELQSGQSEKGIVNGTQRKAYRRGPPVKFSPISREKFVLTCRRSSGPWHMGVGRPRQRSCTIGVQNLLNVDVATSTALARTRCRPPCASGPWQQTCARPARQPQGRAGRVKHVVQPTPRLHHNEPGYSAHVERKSHSQCSSYKRAQKGVERAAQSGFLGQ